MKFQVKQISKGEFSLLESQIRKDHVSVQNQIETWNCLHSYFKKELRDDQKFFFTYFRLYTELTWKLLNTLEREDLIDIIGRQAVAAILLEIDVWNKIVWYLESRTINDEDIGNVFEQIKNQILNSGALVGYFQRKEIKIQDLVPEVKKLNEGRLSSLESAAILSKIRDLFVSLGKDQVEKYYSPDLDVVVDNFLGLMTFLLNVNSNAVKTAVDLIVRPEIFEDQEEIEIEKKGSILIEVKKGIELKYGQNLNNLDSAPQILDELGKKALEVKDERIKDLFLFNEQTGKFEWNDKLLGEEITTK